jgi:hypothetical protein
MSAWQLVNAWSGLQADLVDGTVAFAPKVEGDFKLLWSAGTGWGELSSEAGRLALRVIGGSLPAVRVSIYGQTYPVRALAAGEMQVLL